MTTFNTGKKVIKGEIITRNDKDYRVIKVVDMGAGLHFRVWAEEIEAYDCDGCGKTDDTEDMVDVPNPYGDGVFCQECLGA